MQDPTALQTLLVFFVVCGALIVTGIWEAYVEGRNAWDRGKVGWKIRIGSLVLTGYHFYLFWIMYPLLLSLPLIFTGWNVKLFGILVSAYAIGVTLEDFTWYLANPVVKLSEWFTPFSDYYPWIKIGGKKILPIAYPIGVAIALLSWYFIWR
jgi:hypothetical protein